GAAVQLAVTAHQRRFDPGAAIHPAIVGAPVNAYEVAIDLEIHARPHADAHVVARVEGDVAPLRAAGAHGGRLVQLPGTGFVQEVFRQQRADGTEIDDVTGPR